MMRRRSVGSMFLAALVCAMWLAPALTQERRDRDDQDRRDRDRDRDDQDRRDRRRRGDRDRSPDELRERLEEFRRRAAERLRETLGATAEEWKIIQPRFDAVRDAQTRIRGGDRGFFGFLGRGRGPGGGPGRDGFRGGRGRPDGDRPEDLSEVGRKMVALRQVLDKEDADASEIKQALASLRKARTKAETELAKTREHLREVLTQRQEALLVMMTVLN